MDLVRAFFTDLILSFWHAKWIFQYLSWRTEEEAFSVLF